jgi:long-chain acyl-CoA synthetase
LTPTGIDTESMISIPTGDPTMSEKVWLDSYPANIPAEIASSPFSSLPELIDNTVRKFADKPAFSNLGQTLTFSELDRLSRDFAVFLQGLPGVSQGDRVAIMLPNLLQYPVALFGILRAGMTVVNVNPLYTARELRVQLKDSGAKAIVVVENFARTLQEAECGQPI